VILSFERNNALDTRDWKIYTLATVGCLVRSGIIVLAIVALATVLVTPDPTDDVSGLLNSAQIHFSLPCNGALVPATDDMRQIAPTQLTTQYDFSHLIDSICVRLC
jgi:hypothetical protein